MSDYFEKIEDYLASNLSPEDKAAFEDQLKVDTALARELQAHRVADKSLDSFADKQLKSDLMQRGRDILNPNPKPKVITLARAAAAVGLLLIGIMLFWPKDPGGNQPVAEYGSVEEFLSAVKGPQVSSYLSSSPNSIDSIEANWEALRKLYQEENCDGFLSKFEMLKGQKAFMELHGSEIRLYAGYCNYLGQEFQTAMRQFEAIPQTTSYFLEAQFYLGVIHLKEGAEQKALNSFKAMASNPQSKNLAEAKGIIKLLEK